ncbi:MAG: flagellar protein export ATPase FliI [Waddliaceae bacterium]|nr:flagellar protein export ATPase FliI [Waddliaceae bacterium]
MGFCLDKEVKAIQSWSGIKMSGRVSQIIGLLVESVGPNVHMGEMCLIYNRDGEAIPCEVVGFKDNKVLLMTLGEMRRIAPGSEVYPTGDVHMVSVGEALCGRVIDAMGNPIDGKGPIARKKLYPVEAAPPEALKRNRIRDVLRTGVRAIDGTCTAGKGQRFGIFAGSGVGKSTLMGMIAKMSEADINVIGLIGERGREVREFIERELGPEGLAKSIVVVVTSDQPALLRARGPNVATAIAEYFRDQGKNVVLMMDSITRYCMALREIGLAVGEPPTTKGYTPSVFAMMPKVLERAGNSDKGSITGIYTILVEGDDMNDPIADTARSILDGHIVLSRKLAAANHFPAISVLDSLSRVMSDVGSSDLIDHAGNLRDLLQVYAEAEDLINIGAYAAGSNSKIDRAIDRIDKIKEFLQQKSDEHTAFEETSDWMKKVVSE